MSYFPEDIPYMSKEELRENGIRIPKDAYVEHEKAQLSLEGRTKGTTSDLISRQEAIDVLSLGKEMLSRVLDDIDVVGTDREKYSWGLGLIESYINDIKELPTAQPEPHEGHWIEGKIYRDVIECNCSECGQLMTTAASVRMNYCPNCGARMKGEANEGCTT